MALHVVMQMQLRFLVHTMFNALNSRSHSAVETGNVLIILNNSLYSSVIAPVFACLKASTLLSWGQD